MSTTIGIIALHFILATSVIHAFVAPSQLSPSLRLSSSARQSTPTSAADLFKSEGWPAIRGDLDQVPVFTVANDKGQPLKYQVEMSDRPGMEDGEEFVLQVPFFFTHVDDALAEVEKARQNADMPGLDLIPFPLGQAFEMWATDKAVIVPNKEAITKAGAPPNANPMGQNVPLFACMEVAQETEDGVPMLPLFFDLDDANDAVSQAVGFDGGNADDFEVVSLSLPKAVDMLATTDDKQATAFLFVAPASSLKHIQEYLMEDL